MLFPSFVSGGILYILIDRKLISRRQENPEAFVTLSIVVHYRACQVRAENRLLSFPAIPGVLSSAMRWKSMCSHTQPYYLQEDF